DWPNFVVFLGSPSEAVWCSNLWRWSLSTPNLYPVRLAAEQRQRLEELTHNGHAPAKKILPAQILLLADKEHPNGRYDDAHVARVLGLHLNSVARIRKLFAPHGEAPALERK